MSTSNIAPTHTGTVTRLPARHPAIATDQRTAAQRLADASRYYIRRARRLEDTYRHHVEAARTAAALADRLYTHEGDRSRVHVVIRAQEVETDAYGHQQQAARARASAMRDRRTAYKLRQRARVAGAVGA